MLIRPRITLAVALLTISSACGPAANLRPVSGWLAVSEDFHDFGEIPHGERRRHTFLVKNTGPQTVRLRGIRNACTCASLEKSVLRDGEAVDRPIWDPPERRDGDFVMTWLEPGDTLRLGVVVDTALRPPVDHTEPAKSELHFQPDEAGILTLHYRFRIRARMQILTDLSPAMKPYVELGPHGKNQEAYGVLELAPRDGEDFEIRRIEGTDDRLLLEPKTPKLPGGHKWLVRLLPDGRVGPFDRVLSFHTDLPGDYVLKIAVAGEAIANLQIVPFARLDFGRFPWDRPKETSVTLIYRRPSFDPRFEIGRLEVKTRDGQDLARHFDAAIEGGDAQRWTLRLKYDGKAHGRSFEGWVQLKSADTDHDSTILPFTGYDTGT